MARIADCIESNPIVPGEGRGAPSGPAQVRSRRHEAAVPLHGEPLPRGPAGGRGSRGRRSHRSPVLRGRDSVLDYVNYLNFRGLSLIFKVLFSHHLGLHIQGLVRKAIQIQ